MPNQYVFNTTAQVAVGTSNPLRVLGASTWTGARADSVNTDKWIVLSNNDSTNPVYVQTNTSATATASSVSSTAYQAKITAGNYDQFRVPKGSDLFVIATGGSVNVTATAYDVVQG